MAGVITLSAPEEFSGLDAMASITDIVAPKLFIAARNDSGGAYRGAMNALYDHSLEPKERHLMEGVGHGTQLLSGDFSLQVQGLIMDFLGRYH